MAANAQANLIAQFEKYIAKNGGFYKDYGWYVGVTSDPERRLFREHKVDRTDGAWIYADTSSDAEARDVERRLIEQGAKGGSGGGDVSAIYVYAYLIGWYTEEE